MTFSPDAAARPDSGIFGLDSSPDEAGIVLLPVPFDATTSYGRRAAGGPRAILEASHQVDLYDRDTGRPWQAGITLLPEEPRLVTWNTRARAAADEAREKAGTPEGKRALDEVNGHSQSVNDWVFAEATRWLEAGKVVGVIGGDHATPFGLMSAYAERFPKLGVLHVDAHADLRESYEGFTWSHASIMYNVITRTTLPRLVQVGIRDFGESELMLIKESSRIKTFFDGDLADAQLAGTPFAALAQRIVAELPQEVYVSFDIDGLDPTLCPNTGTPVPGGLSFREMSALLAAVTRSGRRIVGFDLNEVAPGDDGSEWDANVGARVLYKLCGHAALGRPST